VKIIHLTPLRNRLILELELVTREPLHIGAPVEEKDPLKRILKVHTPDMGEVFIIPSSSIKGVLRAEAEKIAPVIFSQNKELLKILKEHGKKGHGKNRDEERNRELECPICRLFGSKYLAAKLRLSDAISARKTDLEIRPGIGIDRMTQTTKKNILYEVETLPTDVLFHLTLIADNVDKQEGLLLAILLEELTNTDFEGILQFGGRKSVGYGSLIVNEKGSKGYFIEFNKTLSENLKKLFLVEEKPRSIPEIINMLRNLSE